MPSRTPDPVRDTLDGLRAAAMDTVMRGRRMLDDVGQRLSGGPPPDAGPVLRGPITPRSPPWPGPPTPQGPYVMSSPLEGRYDINPRRPGTGQGDGHFGKVRTNPDGSPKMHSGVDLTAPIGTPVLSAEPGVVIRADGRDAHGYGNQIMVRHPDGRTTRYGHLSEFDVKPGDKVEQKQRLGLTGRSGNLPPLAEPHLHFEVIQNGRAQPPDAYYNLPGRGVPMSPRIQNRLYGDG